MTAFPDYPNLAAIMSGGVSGSWREWPAIRPELARLAKRHEELMQCNYGQAMAIDELRYQNKRLRALCAELAEALCNVEHNWQCILHYFDAYDPERGWCYRSVWYKDGPPPCMCGADNAANKALAASRGEPFALESERDEPPTSKVVDCPGCEGTGYGDGGEETCTACGGEGWVKNGGRP